MIDFEDVLAGCGCLFFVGFLVFLIGMFVWEYGRFNAVNDAVGTNRLEVECQRYRMSSIEYTPNVCLKFLTPLTPSTTEERE